MWYELCDTFSWIPVAIYKNQLNVIFRHDARIAHSNGLTLSILNIELSNITGTNWQHYYNAK